MLSLISLSIQALTFVPLSGWNSRPTSRSVSMWAINTIAAKESSKASVPLGKKPTSSLAAFARCSPTGCLSFFWSSAGLVGTAQACLLRTILVHVLRLSKSWLICTCNNGEQVLENTYIMKPQDHEKWDRQPLAAHSFCSCMHSREFARHAGFCTKASYDVFHLYILREAGGWRGSSCAVDNNNTHNNATPEIAVQSGTSCLLKHIS